MNEKKFGQEMRNACGMVFSKQIPLFIKEIQHQCKQINIWPVFDIKSLCDSPDVMLNVKKSVVFSCDKGRLN